MFGFGKKTHYQHLAKKWEKRAKKFETQLWENHKDVLQEVIKHPREVILSNIAGFVLFGLPGGPISSRYAQAQKEQPYSDLNKQAALVLDLSHLLPPTVEPLTTNQENAIGNLLTDRFGMPVSAELSGKRLNRSYGKIGAEQHLARCPGDSMSSHFDNQSDWDVYNSSGMAPGLGAWGYFARSQSQMTQKDSDREKWYIAVQTFLVPDYNQHVKEYSDFFKYHKMLVVNPQNGKAIVADIGDAGPADWTGKSLGGSPEVMHFLERQDGGAVGPVIYMFIDDPHDKIPLGPIQE